MIWVHGGHMAQQDPPFDGPHGHSEVSRWRLLCNSLGNGTTDSPHSHKTWDKAMPMGETSRPQLGPGSWGQLDHSTRSREILGNT